MSRIKHAEVIMHGPGLGRVLLDGVELPGVRAVDVHVETRQANRMRFDCIVERLTVSAVDVDAQYRLSAVSNVRNWRPARWPTERPQGAVSDDQRYRIGVR